jgi:hypothetical protein
VLNYRRTLTYERAANNENLWTRGRACTGQSSCDTLFNARYTQPVGSGSNYRRRTDFEAVAVSVCLHNREKLDRRLVGIWGATTGTASDG